MTKTSHVDSPWTRLKWTRKFPIENLFNPLQPPLPSLNSVMRNYLWATTEGVKHVKEHKTRERHGGITWCDHIVSHLKRKPQTIRQKILPKNRSAWQKQSYVVIKQIMTSRVRSFWLHWRNGISLHAKLDLRPTLTEVRQERMIRSMQLPY